MEHWKLLTHPFDSGKHQVLQLQHLAVQFISLTGRYLFPAKDDRSHIAMNYLPDQELIVGQQHPDGWCVSLHLRKLLLQIRDENKTVKNELALEGRSFPEMLVEFKKELHAHTGADVSQIRTEQPYELPKISVEQELFFKIGSQDAVFANIKYRNNANIVLSEVRERFEGAGPIYIWPHHFDTAFNFPAEHTADGKVSKTIVLGWAIPDEIIDEPYYFISLKSTNKIEEQDEPEELPVGEWMMPDLIGAALPQSDIIGITDAEKQKEKVKGFFTTGVNRLVEHFKISH